MKHLYTHQDWFDRLIPQGLPVPASIMLSGPGGSGKPLIGNLFVASWLRQGGSVIFMSLQYPDHRFISSGLKKIADLNLHDYEKKIAFIELDATLEGMQAPVGNWIKANVVKPQVWDQALAAASAMVPDEGPGILIFASAINLLLFSPTYGQEILAEIKRTMQELRHFTYLFSASTSAKREQIAELEMIADHLIMTRSEDQPFRLFIKFMRVKNADFINEEVPVPFAEDVLMDTKIIAEQSRKKVIKLVAKL